MKNSNGPRRLFRVGLAPRLIGLTVLIALVTGTLVGVSLIESSRAALREHILESNSETAGLAVNFAEQYFEDARTSLLHFATRLSLKNAVRGRDLKSAENALKEFIGIKKAFDNVAVYTAGGVGWASGIGDQWRNRGGSVTDRDWFRQTIATKKPYLGTPILSRGTGRAIVTYSVPLFNDEGRIYALLAGGVSLARLSDAITSLQADAYLIDTRQGGVFLAHPDPDLIMAEVTGLHQAERRAVVGARGTMETRDGGEGGYLAAFAPVPGLPWSVLILTPLTSAYAPLDSLTSLAHLFVAAIVLVSAVLGTILARSIVRPVQRLVRGTAEIGRGNLDFRIESKSVDEIGQLSRDFNRMAADLKTVTASRDELEGEIAERKKAELEIRNLARFPAENPAPVLRIAHDGTLAYANQAAQKLIDGEMETGKPVANRLNGVAAEALRDHAQKTIEIACSQCVFSFTAVPFPDAGYVNLYGFDVTRLKKAETDLRALAARFETLLAAVPEILMEVDTHKVYTWSNQAGLDFFGPDVIGREASWYFEGDQNTFETVQPLFDGRLDDVCVESHQRRRDGEIRLLAWHCRTLKDENGRVIGALSSARDVTEQKQMQAEILKLNAELEQRVERRTEQLQAANSELEAFAYSVSHDLRAPLRAVDGFTGILLEDHGAALNEEGKRVCAVIRNNTQRMGQLVDDLLAFSRLGRAEVRRARIDMRKAAEEAFRASIAPGERKHADVSFGDLPAAPADPSLIRQVWINLLSNAVKFSSKRKRAVVSVSGERRGGEAVYCVRDNGAGFDMRHAGKLFGVFQRLHSREEFEGTGAGLAIVKRVVERHGGRVWAESELDKGAAFFFSLPLETDQLEGELDE